jgi:hypothetical protein
MALAHKGLVKLTEEGGEVIQIAAKAMALGELGLHWDGKGLRVELEKEIADLEAAIEVVKRLHGLHREKIEYRKQLKIHTFMGWHLEA